MIVIPMAGMSSRFAAIGYKQPKYMLPLGTTTVFDHAVGSFANYFSTEKFLFIARNLGDTAKFIESSCNKMNIQQSIIVILDHITTGQADTVQLGLHKAGVDDASPVTIFNIDTFRPGFRFPQSPWLTTSAGYLETFEGDGANWSYVRAAPGSHGRVLETAEKMPISRLCCTGLYHFAKAGSFHRAVEFERACPSSRELYVAPLYNHLIAAGLPVHHVTVPRSDIVFCGVPAEYEALLANPSHNAGADPN